MNVNYLRFVLSYTAVFQASVVINMSKWCRNKHV